MTMEGEQCRIDQIEPKITTNMYWHCNQTQTAEIILVRRISECGYQINIESKHACRNVSTSYN